MADEKTRRGAQTRYINQLKKIFNGSPRQAEAMLLIKRAAFFLASLDELEHIIQKEGYVDTYKNGRNQSGTMRRHPSRPTSCPWMASWPR